ncbi:hypothetical protein LMJ53_08220 [Rheinheimera sp. UJ51]|uniref:hypothetical protein n=1 Tax=Rheinheimera sp. UJ51 TaxID=2892446 RepID=UPI001E618C55|nr:hypothetical protein [Rheinheimera sp. UJ51]MCC5451709.1 hypothetical protein [Rheinheimera sp. UJ51]
MRTAALTWLLFAIGLAAGSALAQQQQSPLPGDPLSYLVAEIASYDNNQLTLSDGTVWRVTATQFGLAGTPVLISGRNLKTGSNELFIAGFTFQARYQSGELQERKGTKLTLISSHADGKRLRLTDTLQAFVVDKDRRYSRHWAVGQTVILDSSGQQLLALPSLEQAQVQLAGIYQ